MTLDVAFFLGLITSLTALISFQLKDMRLVLICQIICNGTGAVSYLLAPTSGLSGFAIFAVAILQCIVFFILRCKGVNEPKFAAYVFAAGYLACSLLTYKSPLDIFSAAAAQTCAFGVAQKNASFYRLLLLFNGILWLTYDLLLPAAITITLAHVITIASSFIGIVRLDILAKRKNIMEKKI